MENAPNPIISKLVRNGLVESFHRGSWVFTRGGKAVSSAGDVKAKIFMRSCSKFMQGVAAIRAGAVEEFGLTEEESVLLGASHGGSSRHVALVESIFSKAGVALDCLDCGTQLPISAKYRRELLESGGAPTKLHTNCSGKHAGFLLGSKIKGYPLEEYLAFDHPFQREITGIIGEFCDYPPGEIGLGIDGCGAPVHYLPLVNIAIGFEKAATLERLPENLARAADRLRRAIWRFPETYKAEDRITTALIRATGERFIPKGGAEGAYAAGMTTDGTGFAIKGDDGAMRGYEAFMLHLFHKRGYLSDEEFSKLKRWAYPIVKNFRGDEAAWIEVVLPE